VSLVGDVKRSRLTAIDPKQTNGFWEAEVELIKSVSGATK